MGAISILFCLFTRAQIELPDNAALHYNLGTAYYKAEEFDRASESFTRALSDKRVGLKARYNLGNVALKQGKWEESAAHYIEVLTVKSDHVNAKFNLEFVQKEIDKQKKEEEQEKKDEGNKEENPLEKALKELEALISRQSHEISELSSADTLDVSTTNQSVLAADAQKNTQTFAAIAQAVTKQKKEKPQDPKAQEMDKLLGILQQAIPLIHQGSQSSSFAAGALADGDKLISLASMEKSRSRWSEARALFSDDNKKGDDKDDKKDNN